LRSAADHSADELPKRGIGPRRLVAVDDDDLHVRAAQVFPVRDVAMVDLGEIRERDIGKLDVLVDDDRHAVERYDDAFGVLEIGGRPFGRGAREADLAREQGLQPRARAGGFVGYFYVRIAFLKLLDRRIGDRRYGGRASERVRAGKLGESAGGERQRYEYGQGFLHVHPPGALRISARLAPSRFNSTIEEGGEAYVRVVLGFG
jgi:hypothetical protein